MPQRAKKVLRPTIVLAALAAIACVTINVYFPEAEVKDLSEKIEEAIAQRAAAQAEESPSEEPADAGEAEAPEGAPGPISQLRDGFEVAIGTALYLLAPASPAYAAEVAAPEISNPAIRKIIESRAARVDELDKHKSRGVIGENNQALVEVLDLSSLQLQERAQVQKLVREENADRERMFKEIAAATGADLSQLPQIRSTYAETLRRNAKPGEKIQQPNGDWVTKR
jgi:uncharacterized protein YdbL (DUF1318 family)